MHVFGASQVHARTQLSTAQQLKLGKAFDFSTAADQDGLMDLVTLQRYNHYFEVFAAGSMWLLGGYLVGNILRKAVDDARGTEQK
eukprot:g61126.t1